MDLPPKYLANLTPSQRLLQTRLIRQSQREYQEKGVVRDRPSVSASKPPRSSHVVKFQKKYGFPITNLKKVKSLFPDTDVSKIVSKGYGAYASSGSRPNVTARQWSLARLASVLTGGNAYKVDKDLVGEASRKKIFG